MSQPPLKLLQFTDTHLYAGGDGALLGINTQDSLRAVLDLARGRHWPADLVLATGDLVHDGSPRGYERFLEHFAGLGMPVYCLPGNHDEGRALRAHLTHPEVQWTPHVIRDSWLICLLDTSMPDSEGGHLPESELERLDAVLREYPGHHALVCLHHQPLPVGSAWLDTMAVDNGDAFFAVLDRHPNVRGVLWGHVHQDFRQRRNGVELIATPSTCIQFAPRSSDFAIDVIPPGYRWLLLHSDGKIETGVERLAEMPGELDLASRGY